MALRGAVLSLALFACGGSGGDDDDTPGDAGNSDAPTLPPAKCVAPIELVDTSSPTTVVGTGTPESCDAATLAAAVAAGGIITFDCGAAEHTITVTAPLAAPTGLDTTIDGGGLVTLSGGNTSRILELVHSFEKASPTVTVQRIKLIDGRTTDVANTSSTEHGGAAIYTLGGNIHAIDATFLDNHGPVTGQDVAGGAIYSVGAGAVVVVRSAFAGNACSNGGAVSVLGSDLAIVDSVLDHNTTTGTGGNPGNGGNGGASTMDGQGKSLTLCGATFTNNTANAFGGAIFRTSYENEPTTIDMTNVTIANNLVWEQDPFTETGLVGGINVGDRVTGTWVNVTIVGNKAQFASGVGGASTRLTIRNSIIANDWLNDFTPLNCNGSPASGSANLQFPANNMNNTDVACVAGITFADPMMGALDGATMAPLAGSPALGLGTNCPAKDQLGNDRPATGCTAGAIEGTR